MIKTYRFFYHYNKSHKCMTVHYKGACLLAKDIKCSVSTETKWNKAQPNLVIQGYAGKVELNNSTITIS